MGINGPLFKQRLILSGVILLAIVIGSLALGLGRGGFDQQQFLFQYFLYVGLGVGAMLIIWFFILSEHLTKEKDGELGENLGFYEPDEAPLGFLAKRPVATAYFSLIAFLFIALIAVVRQGTAFTGAATLQQQFTALDESLFNALLVTTSENLGATAVLIGLVFGLRGIVRKFNWDESSYLPLLFFFGPLSVGLYGFANHLLRYGASDFNMLIVFAFWAFIGLLSLLTGNFLVGWMAHVANNVAVALSDVLADSFAFYGLMIGLIVAAIAGFVFFFGGKNE